MQHPISAPLDFSRQRLVHRDHAVVRVPHQLRVFITGAPVDDAFIRNTVRSALRLDNRASGGSLFRRPRLENARTRGRRDDPFQTQARAGE